MTLAVTNSRTRSRAVLGAADRPLTLYSCGPTVYRTVHIGNLRSFLLADLVRRGLALHGVPVRAVQNITDVGHLADDTAQDKMLLASGLEGKAPEEIAAHYTQIYLADAAALNLLPFDARPRATEHIGEMVALIQRLVAAGHAYDTPAAVYFDVRSFPAYGQLSGNDLDALHAGHRIEVDPGKRFHADFALWRKAGARRQSTWDSPWGRGFPGWHIECSAMALAYLGEHIDVHLGGVDLAFPHHECEIAQSEAAVGHRVVDVWLHGEHLLADGRKMAKSTGNVVDLRTITALGIDPLAVRLLLLGFRYRTQANFTVAALRGAARTLARLRARTAVLAGARAGPSDATEDRCLVEAARLEAGFVAAIDDDLDTPAALRIAHTVAAGVAGETGDAAACTPAARLALMRRFDQVLALDLDRDIGASPATLPAGVAALIQARQTARATSDWAASDRLRAELAALGVHVVDTAVGQEWTVTS